jgi:hypothetical protein
VVEDLASELVLSLSAVESAKGRGDRLGVH